MRKIFLPAIAVAVLIFTLSCTGSTGPTDPSVRDLYNNNGKTTDELGVAVSPQTILLSSEQKGSIMVHTCIPISIVETDSLELNEVPVFSTKSDDCGHVVGYFNSDAIKATLEPGYQDMTLTGLYIDGTEFSGTDKVHVMP